MTPVKYEPKQPTPYAEMHNLHRQLSESQVAVRGDTAYIVLDMFNQAFTDLETIVNGGTAGLRAARSTARLRYECIRAQMRMEYIVVSDLPGVVR